MLVFESLTLSTLLRLESCPVGVSALGPRVCWRGSGLAPVLAPRTLYLFKLLASTLLYFSPEDVVGASRFLGSLRLDYP